MSRSQESLSARARNAIREVERHLARGDVLAAERALPGALIYAPAHVATMRLAARVHRLRGRLDDAIAILGDAVRSLGHEVDLLAELGALQAEAGRWDDAIATRRLACDSRPDATSWTELALALDHAARTSEALDAAGRALALEPSHARARLLRARCLQATGDIAGAAADYRFLTRDPRHAAAAWFALLDIKTIVLDANETESLKRFAASPARTPHERMLLDFACARVAEQAGQPAEALDRMHRANAVARNSAPWDARAHRAYVNRVMLAFASPRPAATNDTALGSDVIFIVGLPRSGSTLFEQILAAHPDIEGGSELPDLPAVIAAESARRAKPFPEWVADATEGDWKRLGAEYLARTAMWRARRPKFSDKAPENWQFAGAIAAMLPGARIIDCRRDAVETCFSCYTQLFAPGRVGFAYAFADLADYWIDYERASTHWASQRPDRYRTFHYEELIAAPDATTRALLAFCDVEFRDECLRPQSVRRAIRTSSSAQVLEPIRRDTARASTYGGLLDPLRIRLGLPPLPAPSASTH